MIRKAKTFLRRFRKEEDGNMTIEFVIAIPLIFTLFLTSVEMGIYAVRQNFLDRGLDMAVRDVRLGTGKKMSHQELKTRICGYAGFLTECDKALKVQMTTINPRAFSGFGGSAECSDTALPITPSQIFVHGAEHQLMLIRACYMFKPVFPSTGLGKAFTKDGTGRMKMVSLSAFVQEPSG